MSATILPLEQEKAREYWPIPSRIEYTELLVIGAMPAWIYYDGDEHCCDL